MAHNLPEDISRRRDKIIKAWGKPQAPAPNPSCAPNGATPPEPAPTIVGWPDPLKSAALHGPAGELVRLIEPHSEADPTALLLQTLIGWGSLAGRGPHMLVEADRHHTNEYVVLVGTSSKARKGSSWSRVASILRSIDEHWSQHRLIHGLGSGEKLIDRAAESDHRALVLEGEFSRLLAVINREGTTLSSVLRNGWDHGHLEVNVRNKEARASGAHVSLIGHITRDELLRRLSDVELANGFGNRILWTCARRSKKLPRGGGKPETRAGFSSGWLPPPTSPGAREIPRSISPKTPVRAGTRFMAISAKANRACSALRPAGPKPTY
jgi:hypothetical protein